MRTLWEPGVSRGQCGKAGLRGLAIGVLIASALVAASLSGLI